MLRVLPSFAPGLLAAAVVSLSAVGSAQEAGASDYVVLAAFAEGDPFDGAAQALVAGRDATLVRFSPDDLEPLREGLTAAMPRHVAIVIRPEQLEFNLQRRMLQLLTELDDDPFVDCSYGYITGATPAVAQALVTRGLERQPLDRAPRYATVAGGVGRSTKSGQPFSMRGTTYEARRYYVAGKDRFPETGRDLEFLAGAMGELSDRDAVLFIGHGWPREVVGGPTFAELEGAPLEDAVVLNVACYTGVTDRYYQTDWRQGRVDGKTVPDGESFCLALLGTGVVGYTAYLCPRPAGPELDADLAALFCGSSLGDARRRDYDKTVLGYLGYGSERLQLEALADGQASGQVEDAVRDMMLEGATGGVVFGDPAVVPFAGRPDAAPVAVTTEAWRGGDGVLVTFEADVRVLGTQCSDQTAKWGRSMAMKTHARVPLGQAFPTQVEVLELRIGDKRVPSRVVWALEEDRGERFVQLKVNWQRDQKVRGDLHAKVRITTTGDAAAAVARGGHVVRTPARSKDVRSTEIQEFMLPLAAAREVSKEALQAALDASARLVGSSQDVEALERFEEFGAEGYRAALVLVEAGHTHHRSDDLLRRTWSPGLEADLIALAAREDLPNYADWTALRALAISDTPEAREFLRYLLEHEEDAGRYMSAAEAMARLGMREASGPIGERVLEWRPQWSGVSSHLVEALGQLGDEVAVAHLERIAEEVDDKGRMYSLTKRTADALLERFEREGKR